MTIVISLQDLSNFGNFVGGLGTAIALLFAYIQIRKATRAQYLSAWTILDGDLSSDRQRNARKTLHANPLPEPAAATDEQWELVSTIANCIDRVGFFVEHGFIPARIIHDRYASIIFRSWGSLKPYVEYNREVRARSKRSWRYFELITKSADHYLSRNFPDHMVGIYRVRTTKSPSPSE